MKRDGEHFLREFLSTHGDDNLTKSFRIITTKDYARKQYVFRQKERLDAEGQRRCLLPDMQGKVPEIGVLRTFLTYGAFLRCGNLLEILEATLFLRQLSGPLSNSHGFAGIINISPSSSPSLGPFASTYAIILNN